MGYVHQNQQVYNYDKNGNSVSISSISYRAVYCVIVSYISDSHARPTHITASTFKSRQFPTRKPKGYDRMALVSSSTHSGGNNFSSSIVPKNPKSVLICSDVVLGETLVTWTTFVV